LSDEDKVDFSPLDPDRDPEHWHRFRASTLTRVDSILGSRRDDPFVLIAGWSRPILAAAGILAALIVGSGPALRGIAFERGTAGSADRLATVTVESLSGDGSPTGAELYRALLEGYER